MKGITSHRVGDGCDANFLVAHDVILAPHRLQLLACTLSHALAFLAIITIASTNTKRVKLIFPSEHERAFQGHEGRRDVGPRRSVNHNADIKYAQISSLRAGGLQSISTAVGEMIAGNSDTRGSTQKKADDASASLGEFANPKSRLLSCVSLLMYLS